MRVHHPWEGARRSAASLVLIVSMLAVGCAPVAVPPAAPAKPAEAVKPSEAANPATAAAPATPAAVSAASHTGAAKVQPKGAITVVIEEEPDTILPKDGTTPTAGLVLMNVYDQLTSRDWSTGTMKIVPRLAESWEQSQSDPKTWRFKLRQGLKFINGEPFNADAVVALVDSIVDPAKPGLSIETFGLSGAKATRIDDYTVDITTKEVDAIFPSRIVKMPIPAPRWLANSPNDSSITQAVGSGPYTLAEYTRGSHFLLKANEDYWGAPKPTIAEIKIIFRNEAAVRASMLQAGEVQLAMLLTPEAAKQMPASLVELTGDSVGIKINHEHPVLKDLRVRQAINLAFDRKSMIDSLYGEVAELLNGMLIRKSAFGWNSNLQEYPYDPAKAKQLIQEAGAVGTSLTLISRNGVVPRVDEVTELFANQVNQTGLKVTVQSMELSQWRTANRQVKSGEPRPDLLLTSSTDPVLDSSRTFLAYFQCGGVTSLWCDQVWTAKLNNVLGLTGDARSRGLQELWVTTRDQNVVVPLFGLNFIHGLSPKLHWGEPRRDVIRMFSEWTLDD